MQTSLALRAPHSGPRLASVLVVIPTLNEERHIRDVVLGLLSDPLTERGGMTIVVADGGSQDRTAAIVRELSEAHEFVHLLDNPARLQSAGVNRAVQRFGAGKTWLLRCDAHAEYPTGFASALLTRAEQVGADAVVVPLDSLGSGAVERAIAWVSNSKLGTGGAAHRAGTRSQFVDHGHHALFRLSSFAGAGGYDETLACNEDAELDCRQRLIGARIFLDADVRVGYHPRSTLGALAKQYFRYGAGRSRTVRRHPASLRIRQLVVPLHLVACVLALALAPFAPLLLLYPLAYLTVLGCASLAFALSRRSSAGLLVGVAALVMHLSWGAGFIMSWFTAHERPFSRSDIAPLPMAGALAEADGGAELRKSYRIRLPEPSHASPRVSGSQRT